MPAAAIVGAVSAAVANTGVFGVFVVAGALVAAAYTIWAISRRNAVSADNVNDATEVVVVREHVPAA